MTRYEDIFEALKDGILRGKYDAERPIPSERALMRTFGTSRNAIRHAVDELEKAKFVRRHHGRRTEVVYGGRGHRMSIPRNDFSLCPVLDLKTAVGPRCFKHGGTETPGKGDFLSYMFTYEFSFSHAPISPNG